jgi:hypothetical protein
MFWYVINTDVYTAAICWLLGRYCPGELCNPLKGRTNFPRFNLESSTFPSASGPSHRGNIALHLMSPSFREAYALNMILEAMANYNQDLQTCGQCFSYEPILRFSITSSCPITHHMTCLQTFRMNLLLPSSWWKNKPSKYTEL